MCFINLCSFVKAISSERKRKHGSRAKSILVFVFVVVDDDDSKPGSGHVKCGV